MERAEYEAKEERLLELERFFRNKPEYYTKVVHNLIQLYVSQNDYEKMIQLSGMIKTDKLRELAFNAQVILEAKNSYDDSLLLVKNLDKKIVNMRSEMEETEKIKKEIDKYYLEFKEGKIDLDKTIIKYDHASEYINKTIETDRMRSVEILGIFAAIIAFIITGVNHAFFSSFSVWETIILISQIGFALFTFVLALQILFPLQRSEEVKRFNIFLFSAVIIWQIFIGFLLFAKSQFAGSVFGILSFILK